MKKGQAIIYGIMLAVFGIITATLLAGPLKDQTDLARNNDNLQCDYANQSTGTYLTCSAVDLTLPFFIITVIAVSIAAIVMRGQSSGE